MATLQRRRKHGDKGNERNGTWEIQFRDENGRKQTITLSGKKFKERIVRQFKDAVEVLVDKRINGDPTKHRPTEEWVGNAVPEIRAKLAKFDLWQKPSKHTVKELCDEFLANYTFDTDNTRKTYLTARKRFDMFFKPNELITKLTKARIEQWKTSLLADGRWGVPTVAGTIQKAKTVFNWAKE